MTIEERDDHTGTKIVIEDDHIRGAGIKDQCEINY